MLALAKLSKLKTKAKGLIHNAYFCAYLASKNIIVLTRVDQTAKLKKYWGDDKLSNGRYAGGSTKEVELGRFYL